MTTADVLDDFKSAFKKRKFAAGLLVALIDFLAELHVFDAESPVRSLDDLLEHHPRVLTAAGGKSANTLIVEVPGGSTLSIRPHYNRIERYFHAEAKRFDYPSCAPHATQAWGDYVHWIDALCQMTASEAAGLRQHVVDHVLAELPSQSFDPESRRDEPPLFRMILEDFDFAAKKGEPSGASLQGAVFGFIRADNPHLQVEIDKVRTGSRRRSRVGDVDAWEGNRLAISAEVKSRHVNLSLYDDLQKYAHEVSLRGAIGLLVALSFDGDARDAFEASGIIPLDLQDLVGIVRLWDPAKQRIATESMMYYAAHVERNSSLIERLDVFLRAAEVATDPPDA